MFDYDEITKKLEVDSVIKLMKKLGADVIDETDGYVIFQTICHHVDASEGSPKLYFYKDNHIFYCYTECGGMNIFTFLKNYYETRDIEYNWYEDIYDVVMSCTSKTNFDNFEVVEKTKFSEKYRKRGKVILPEYPKGVLDVFIKKYPLEWIQDNITPEAMDKFNILYSISQNKIIIPHYDVNGRLVGIRGRALNDFEVEKYGKYMPVKIENIWYTHKLSFNLYGLNETKNNIKRNGYVYVFESEKSTLQMEGFKQDNCSVAVCGSHFNKYQLNILMKECHPKEIIICFDKEELPGQETYFYKIYNTCKKYLKYCNFSFIYDRENLLELKDSPTDKGEEIFEKLKNRRVVVE